MKKFIILTLGFLAISTFIFAQSKAGKQDLTRHITISSCPVHHSDRVHQAGKCPNCGMDLGLSQKEQVKMEITRAYSCPANASNNTWRKGSVRNLSAKEEMKMQVARIDKTPTASMCMNMAMAN